MALSTLMIKCTDYSSEQIHELAGHVPSVSDSGQDMGRTSLLFSRIQAVCPLPMDRFHLQTEDAMRLSFQISQL